MFLSVSTKIFYANVFFVTQKSSLTYDEINEFRLILAHILYDMTHGYFRIGEIERSYPYGSRIPENDYKIEFRDNKTKPLHFCKFDSEVVLMTETDNPNIYCSSDVVINEHMLKQINYYCSEETKEALRLARLEYSKRLVNKPLNYKEYSLKYRFNTN